MTRSRSCGGRDREKLRENTAIVQRPIQVNEQSADRRGDELRTNTPCHYPCQGQRARVPSSVRVKDSFSARREQVLPLPGNPIAAMLARHDNHWSATALTRVRQGRKGLPLARHSAKSS